MNWKPRIWTLTGWRPKNRQRMEKNDGKSSRNHPRKRLRSVTEAPRFGFFSRKHVFSPKTTEMHSIGSGIPLKQPICPLINQNGEELAAQLAQASQASSWSFLMHPQITKFTYFSYFTEKLRNPYRSVSDLIFLFFIFPFTNLKRNILTQGFWKFYGSITEALKALF